MLGRREPALGKVIPLAVGATAGLAAGLYFLGRAGRDIMRRRSADNGLEALEQRVVDALVEDETIAGRSLEIAALSYGIIEVTGEVRDDDEARRVVALAQSVPGVRTVLNRMDVEELEGRLAQTRQRYDDGDPALHETHWYGVRVGTGSRRQGRSTDPDQRDDRVDSVERALGTDRSIEQSSDNIPSLPNAVQGHSSGTGATARSNGNGTPEEAVDPDPYGGVHHNIKPGDELALEQLPKV